MSNTWTTVTRIISPLLWIIISIVFSPILHDFELFSGVIIDSGRSPETVFLSMCFGGIIVSNIVIAYKHPLEVIFGNIIICLATFVFCLIAF